MKSDSKQKMLIWVFSFFILLIFSVKSIIFLDPDFGWRLKTGEMILKQGIPKQDPFTYTMPTFAWVDHAWSLSLLICIVYSLSGFVGLSIVFSFITWLSILISGKQAESFLKEPKTFDKNLSVLGKGKTSYLFSLPMNFESSLYFVAIPTILATSILFTFSGIRVQVFSWLMISIIIGILLNEKNFEKLRFLLPFLFLIWSNLHGSFAIGIEGFLLFLFLRSIRLKKFLIFDWIIFLFCCFVTFINPYRLGIWREVWSSISDSSLRWRIVEWMPALTMIDLSMATFIGLSLGFVAKYKDRFKLEEKGLFFLFLIQAFASRRHLPLWAILAIPITVRGIFFLYQDAKKAKLGISRFVQFYKVALLSTVILFIIQIFFGMREAFVLSEKRFYPEGAVLFLKQNLPEGEIFSEYGWGGYLIWKLPEKKVFIDGRMPSWRRDLVKEDELQEAFGVYEDILRGRIDYRDVFNRFDVKVVLWGKPKEKKFLDNLFESFEKYLEIFGWKPNDFDFLKTLEADGWQKIYQDEVAVVYKL